MSAGLRLWILLLAGTSFLAGLAGGVAVGLEVRPDPGRRGAFSDYEALLVERFDLSPERARGLRVVLDHYERRIENLYDESALSLEPELARLGVTFHGVIRNTVLPADRRGEFDRLAAGGSGAAPTPEIR